MNIGAYFWKSNFQAVFEGFKPFSGYFVVIRIIIVTYL